MALIPSREEAHKLAAELNDSLPSKPDALKPYARNIIANLEIIAMDDTKKLPEEREAAWTQLIQNQGHYERVKAALVHDH